MDPAIHTRLRAIGVSQREDGAFDVRLEGEGNLHSLSARALIFATPTDVSGSLLGQLHVAFEPLLATVEYASVAVVSQGYRKSDVGHSLDGFGFLVPRSAGLRVLGTVWNSSLFPGRAPRGHALITSFVGGTTDPAAAMLKPEELATLVHREISPLLSIKSEPIFSNVQIWPRALPQYNLGHAYRLTAVAKLLQNFPGIWLAGNYRHGPAIGSCVEQATTVAEEVRKALNA
jgi:oxygen-dependent protoporphyrinogen oxidase